MVPGLFALSITHVSLSRTTYDLAYDTLSETPAFGLNFGRLPLGGLISGGNSGFKITRRNGRKEPKDAKSSYVLRRRSLKQT